MDHEAILDVGCGPKKTPGAYGVDAFAYPGVDLVADLNVMPWPLPDNTYTHIISNHFIEHVQDVLGFMAEIHRVAKPGALVTLTTPHFTSVNSWSDPTHLRHLSAQWYKPFVDDGWMAQRGQRFQVISSRVAFGRALRSLWPRLMVKLAGQNTWEKHFAFIYPAQDLTTQLRVIK